VVKIGERGVSEKLGWDGMKERGMEDEPSCSATRSTTSEDLLPLDGER